ncbi:hypothetical protein DL95DRAFT_452975 [Leptodontidium sp. 2 PMI_412]|nr:hypothetical protein DL95DRAFT_452975 [Leptodontidium sp. 2 PMI_412]
MKAQAQGCTLLFALHSLTTVAQCGPLIAERDIFMPLVTQRDIGIECRLSVSTDIWTTCLTFITMYNITLPEMFNMNPLVEEDCFGFKPGSEYCVMAREFPMALASVGLQIFGDSFLTECDETSTVTRAPTSKNGLCGIQSPTKVTCVNSGFGDCCGSSGRCGSTDEFCAIGNCQEGDCPGLGYSTDGFCGGGHDDTVCAEAPLQNADLAIANLAPVFHLQRLPHQLLQPYCHHPLVPLLTAHADTSRVTSVPTRSTTLEIAVQQLDTVVHHNITVTTFKDAKRNSVSVTGH